MSHVENVTRGDALVALMIGSAVLIVFTPIAGHLSDKMSRARLYAFGTIIMYDRAFRRPFSAGTRMVAPESENSYGIFFLLQETDHAGRIFLIELAVQ